MKKFFKITLFLLIFISLIGFAQITKVSAQGSDPIEIRHMRSDTISVNGLSAYNLGTSQTGSSQPMSSSIVGDVSVTWGIRVWKRASSGAETEITGGVPVAQVSRSVDGHSLQNATWDCPFRALASTDSIVVRVYMRFGTGPWLAQATFTTERLGASQLNASTWTVFYYTQRTFLAGQTLGVFSFGDSATDSRIENFAYAKVASWPHVSINLPASVAVDQEFSVSLTYTHDAAERGGIHLRWLDDKFDITDMAGCTDYVDNPSYASGWEGIECNVNSGTTKTFKLKALSAGGQTLYYRAWDWTQDYPCGGAVGCSGTASYETPGADTCSSEYSSTYACANASNGNTGDFWFSAAGNIPGWTYGDLGTKKCISGIRVYVYSPDVPETMDIQVSDNASSWTTVVSGWTVSTGDTWVEKTFSETAGRYVRLYITSAARSWSEIMEYQVKTRTYTGGGVSFDYNRDPLAGFDYNQNNQAGTCSPNCDPNLFPDKWEECNTFSQGITVTGGAAFDFSLSADPSSATLDQGNSTSTSITATLAPGATTQPIALSAPSPESSISLTWSPNSTCNPTCSRTLNITAAVTTPPGFYQIIIKGEGGGVTKTTTFNLTVGAGPSFNFSLSASPNSATVKQGDSTSTIVTATLAPGATSQPIALSAPPPESSISLTWSPNNTCNPTCSRTLNITTAVTTPASTYHITITGFDGGITRTTFFDLTVMVSTNFCDQLRQKINAAMDKSCGQLGYDYIADVNNDGIVNGDDLTMVNSSSELECQQMLNNVNRKPCCSALLTLLQTPGAFGKGCGDAGYNYILDVNKDGKVDIVDAATIAKSSEIDCEGYWADTFNPCFCTLKFGESSYNLGEEIIINYTDAPTETQLSLFKPGAVLAPGFPVSVSGTGNRSYTLQATDPPGTWQAGLKDSNCDTSASVEVYSGVPCAVVFATSPYSLGQQMVINYQNAPPNSKLTLFAPNDEIKMEEIVSGSDSKSYDLKSDDLTGTWRVSLKGIDCSAEDTVKVSKPIGPTCQILLDRFKDAFGRKCGDAKYDPVVDVASPLGEINILDATTIAKSSEEQCQDFLYHPYDPCKGLGFFTFPLKNPLQATSFEELVDSIINIVLYIAMGLVPLMAILAGFYFITSAGEPEKLKRAKDILIYTAIGLFVALLAKAIVAIIKKLVGG